MERMKMMNEDKWVFRKTGRYFAVNLFGVKIYVTRATLCAKLPKSASRGLRKLVYERSPRCQMCGRELTLTTMEVHHIIPKSERPDLKGDLNNLMALCHECHVRHHAQEREMERIRKATAEVPVISVI